MVNRREFLIKGSAAGAILSATAGAASASPAIGSESARLFLPPDHLNASTADRLPLSWSKGRFRVLQGRLAETGHHGILLTNEWNILYFTGLFYTSTERMTHCFIPTVGDHPVWFYPALDRDSVQSWWYEDGDMYFDWPNVEGAAPQEGKVVRGPKQDLWRWALEGLKRRGFGGKKLAVDKELVPSAQKTAAALLGRPMASAEDECLRLRQRKTPEELALTRRAYAYFDRIHAFARDLIMTHGTDLTDFDVGNAANKFGTDLILADIKHDGRPHSGVGIVVDIGCRVGRTTGYPHPNQFQYSRIERGKALQVNGVVQIGGCGGELYRPYMIAPRTAHMEKLWTVTRDCCLMQKDLSRKGIECGEIALRIHEHQVKEGMQKYIYTRVAHGAGMENHQPPFIALGDRTPLDTSMCFSVEPGLYDPETGIGANFSDIFVVEPEGPALQMSRLPWSEEWAWIKI